MDGETVFLYIFVENISLLYISCLLFLSFPVRHTLNLYSIHFQSFFLFSLSLQVSLTPSFCKFSFLTLCQVEGRGHPGVNCSACNGWGKAESNFHTHFFAGSIATVAKPCTDLERKEKPSLTCQPFSKEEIRREKGSERKRERCYHGSHLTSSQSYRF